MPLRSIIHHNFWLKLFSLVLALMIWFAVRALKDADYRIPQNPITNPVTQEFIRLPVMVLTQPADARVFQVEPAEVSVSIMAESAVMRDLKRPDFRAYVDLTDVQRGTNGAQKVRIHIPPGITIFRVAPLAVHVEQISP